ncbi:uncharacterized protein LOC130947371 [Arachis stenosperma]|uniref:uncharacterized protein LOC130947371 n=1 Tax=Arachis stenosperma TaxID=217475 RepID=UPI0025AB7C27|nr:uncharacterized protein LOC130947371 [Arachis stenosperma]
MLQMSNFTKLSHAYTSKLQLKVDHLLEENARLKRQQQTVNLFLRFHAPKNVSRKRGLMLKLTSLHLLMMKIWTPLLEEFACCNRLAYKGIVIIQFLEQNKQKFSGTTDFGLMKIDDKGRILSFSEKPKEKDLKAMEVDTTVFGLSKKEAVKKPYIAAMGVYVFKKEILLNLLRLCF